MNCFSLVLKSHFWIFLILFKCLNYSFQALILRQNNHLNRSTNNSGPIMTKSIWKNSTSNKTLIHRVTSLKRNGKWKNNTFISTNILLVLVVVPKVENNKIVASIGKSVAVLFVLFSFLVPSYFFFKYKTNYFQWKLNFWTKWNFYVFVNVIF